MENGHQLVQVIPRSQESSIHHQNAMSSPPWRPPSKCAMQWPSSWQVRAGAASSLSVPQRSQVRSSQKSPFNSQGRPRSRWPRACLFLPTTSAPSPSTPAGRARCLDQRGAARGGPSDLHAADLSGRANHRRGWGGGCLLYTSPSPRDA